MGLGGEEELSALTSLQRRICHLGLVFQQLFWHSRAQVMWSCGQYLSRPSVGWGSAGLAPRGTTEAGAMFRRGPAPVLVCSGTSSSNSTSLASSSPCPTALAVLSLITGPPVQQAGHLVGHCTVEKLSEPQATGLAGWSGRLGILATGVTCPAPMCMRSLRAARAETVLSLHLLCPTFLQPKSQGWQHSP